MVKEFHAWVAERANSIEDKSQFIKPTYQQPEPKTALQIRALFADLLVPKQKNRHDIKHWVNAFCMQAGKNIIYPQQASLLEIMNKEEYDKYSLIDDNEISYISWFLDFRKKIADGWQP